MKTPSAPGTIKVRVLPDHTGYIYDTHRDAGDVFLLTPRVIPLLKNDKPVLDPATGEPKTRILSAEDQFSANWMEKVDDDEPERLTTAQPAINKITAELNANPRGKPKSEE